jgi:cyclopropane fatty-acyl-phospholipid synthase-like methyltransferase
VLPQEKHSLFRNSHYQAYASNHAGEVDGTSDAVLQRDIVERLPEQLSGSVLDLGCGQGQLVRLLLHCGHDARGVDISPEQVSLAHRAGITQVEYGDAIDIMSRIERLVAVTGTDFFEHLTREENALLLRSIHDHLTTGGLLIGRVPNAVSPFGGYYRHGDVTHESWYTKRSLQQQLSVAGFTDTSFFPCTPLAHGPKSALRASVWRLFGGFYKASLAAETGVMRGHIVTQNLVFVSHRR